MNQAPERPSPMVTVAARISVSERRRLLGILTQPGRCETISDVIRTAIRAYILRHPGVVNETRPNGHAHLDCEVHAREASGPGRR